uniref:Uncharacterized protein n=2 Tax=Ciona intestinalis TaxID=7719 RepID=H2XML8_CIOIN
MSSFFTGCFQLLIHVLLLILGCGECQQQVPCNETQNNTFQRLYYYYWKSALQSCSWKFESPNNSTDYAVLITLLFFVKDKSSDPTTMNLPDGNDLTSTIKVTKGTAPRCVLYTSPYSNCSHFGKHDCETEKSKDWPPRLNITSRKVWIQLTYLIIDCPSDVTTTHALTTTFVSKSTPA